MQIIPVINCDHLDCAVKKIQQAEKFLAKEDWLHLDAADGRFTFNKSWSDAKMWPKLKADFNLEVHLMVEEPEKVIDEWLAAGAKRIIVHFETLADFRFRPAPPSVEKLISEMLQKCSANGCELMLALNPDTPIEKANECLDRFGEFQVLAVHPGLAGQKFLPLVLDKMKFLRQEFPGAKIEIDGGINLQTARLAKAAGADIAASGTYIWSATDPKVAYQELRTI